MRIFLFILLLFTSGCGNGNGIVVIVGSDGFACMKKVDGKYVDVPCGNLTLGELDKARWINAMGVKVK